MWSGAVTSSGAKVKAKVTGTSTRLAVADNADMVGPTFFGPVVPSLGVATLTATGLDPDTQYWYRIEDNSVIDTTKTGRFHTHGTVGEPYVFTFAAASCAGSNPFYPASAGLAPNRLSNHPVYDQIRVDDPLWFSHMGDLHYYDPGSGVHVPSASLSTYRSAYDDVLAVPRQGELYRNVPVVYCWDDHDFGGNESDGTFASKANAAQVYRERVPHYPLAQPSGPIYHSFQVGRVLVVVTDPRYNRASPETAAPRTYLGAAQLTWLDNLLATSTAELLVWQTAQPPNSAGHTSWGSYTEERADIYQMFGDHGWIGKMLAIAGDQHQFGFDSGSHTAGFPLYTLSPLDSSANIGGFAYDLGYHALRGQYGTIEVDDRGYYIRVTTKGWYAYG